MKNLMIKYWSWIWVLVSYGIAFTIACVCYNEFQSMLLAIWTFFGYLWLETYFNYIETSARSIGYNYALTKGAMIAQQQMSETEQIKERHPFGFH